MKKNLKKLFAIVLAVSIAALSLTLTVGAEATKLQIAVDQAEALPGEFVDVKIKATTNPGVVGLTLTVNYDSGLVLEAVTDGGKLGTYVGEPENFESGYKLAWVNDTATQNFIATGIIATLRFRVATTATAGDKNITLSLADSYDAMNYDLEAVATEFTAGKITVADEAYVAGGKCGINEDNAEWAIYQSGLFLIFGQGKLNNKYVSTTAPWQAYKQQITKLVVREGITDIPRYAFTRAINLAEFDLPSTLTAIEAGAFYGCTSIEEFEFPAGVTKIGYYAFYNTSALKEITIPATVTSIGEYAFAYCTSLKKAVINANIKALNPGMFSSCPALEEVVLPAGLESIGMKAFNACMSLKYVNIPSSVKSIGAYAFYNDIGLTDFVIPEGVTTLDTYMLGGYSANPSAISTIVLPTTLTSVGVSALGIKSSLLEVYYNGTEAQFDTITFAKSNGDVSAKLYNHYFVAGGDCGTDVKWALYDNGKLLVTGNGAMDDYQACPFTAYADQITEVKFMQNVTSVGDNAFAGLTSLTAVDLGRVQTIGTNAFAGDTALAEVIISSNVVEICANAFTDLDRVLYQFKDTEVLVQGTANVTADTVTYATAYGTCGTGAKWAVYGNELVISGTGKLNDYKATGTKAPWNEYAATITKATVKDGVKSIGAYAFAGLNKLVDVTITDNVTALGSAAFFQCSSLVEITLPEKLTSIGNNCFRECTSLKTVNDNEALASVGEYAFYSCTSLESFVFPRKVTEIPANTFYGCTALKSIELSDKITAIGTSAFEKCSALEEIKLPRDIKTIGSRAFRVCSKLTSIEIPVGTTTIESQAFAYCNKVTYLYMPNTVTSLGANAFSGMTSLNVKYEGLATEWSTLLATTNETDNSVLYKVAVVQKALDYATIRTNLRWVAYDNGTLEVIGTAPMNSYAATTSKGTIAPWREQTYTNSIKKAIFCEGVPNVAKYALYTMPVEEVVIESATTIEASAFMNCAQLTTVTIPATVTSIGNYAFSGCTSLTTVNFLGTQEQWDAITIGTNNAPLTGLTVNCLG